MENLPDSYQEVMDLSNLWDNTVVFTGEEATERKIKNLAQTGELKNYRNIHFSTHGLALPDFPEFSAIVLSQPKNDDSEEDGYLTAAEILDFDLNADMVSLSACETGLGKIYQGEGIFGLTHTFMTAGANSMLVSLWSVNDRSTSEFMISVYDLVKEGIDYPQAVSKTKQKFIQGDYGEEYKKPYYWAPFVYYGK